MEFAKTIILKLNMGCNLRCRYCYEFNRNGDTYQNRHIPIGQLEVFLQRVARLFPGSRILWMLHGGEPLINGVEYFRQFAACIRRINRENRAQFTIALQTNASLLTDVWMKALEENLDLMSERIVSVSIDGPGKINDTVRVTESGGSSFQMTMDAIERIKASDFSFTTLSVVGSHNVDKPDEVYRFIRDLNPNFAKFIPCYNFDNSGQPEKFGIYPVQYANFMCRIFDLWIHDLPNKNPKNWFVIDPIATIVSTLTDTFVTWCEYRAEKCDNFAALYPDGELWLCDTFDHDSIQNAGCLGNIFTLSDKELIRALSQSCQVCSYEKFYKQNTESCTSCEIEKFCHGGCIAIRSCLRSKSEKLSADYCKAKRILIKYIQRGVSLALS